MALLSHECRFRVGDDLAGLCVGQRCVLEDHVVADFIRRGPDAERPHRRPGAEETDVQQHVWFGLQGP